MRNDVTFALSLVSRFSPSIIHSRTFATEEAKTEAPELTESEKKLTEEVDKLVKDVEGLTEKNKELDVSKLWRYLLINNSTESSDF
jgi:peptidoglycan hydrolase CwlO-like protein